MDSDKKQKLISKMCDSHVATEIQFPESEGCPLAML